MADELGVISWGCDEYRDLMDFIELEIDLGIERLNQFNNKEITD